MEAQQISQGGIEVTGPQAKHLMERETKVAGKVTAETKYRRVLGLAGIEAGVFKRGKEGIGMVRLQEQKTLHKLKRSTGGAHWEKKKKGTRNRKSSTRRGLRNQ